MLPGPWTIQAGKGLGEHPSPPLTSPLRKQGSKRSCPGLPMPPTSVMPPATSSVWCFYSATLMVVNSLRATTRSAHHPCSSLPGVQQYLGSVWACRVLGGVLQVLILRTDGAKTIVLPFLPRGP